jgi:acyl-CoA synthetase (AMP-forming)/AMP-acid ligase II
VIGIPDPVWKQRVKAIVVRTPDRTVSEDELIEHCRGLMASYKKPSTVEFVDSLPRKGAALDYDELDRSYGGGGYPGG